MDNEQGTSSIAHVKLLSVMWQPGWEGRLGEKGYMFCSPFVVHLKHHIINWL